MSSWKEEAEHLFFVKKRSLTEISEELCISRQSISAHLKKHPDYDTERNQRKEMNRANRREYKREKSRQYREKYRMKVTQETMKREHDIAAMLLSHEKY